MHLLKCLRRISTSEDIVQILTHWVSFFHSVSENLYLTYIYGGICWDSAQILPYLKTQYFSKRVDFKFRHVDIMYVWLTFQGCKVKPLKILIKIFIHFVLQISVASGFILGVPSTRQFWYLKTKCSIKLYNSTLLT